MALTIILLLLGFAFIIKGADFLVDGASSLAKKLHISDLAIGLTIVAFGTSTPELVVNVISSIQGTTEIAIGNVLGSNIANVFLILGIAAVIYPLKVTKGTVWKEIPFSLLATILLGILASDRIIDHQSFSTITRIDGLVLLAFFVIFLYYTVGIAKNGVPGLSDEQPDITRSVPKSLLWIALGLIGLITGGKWVVDSAIEIAQLFGVSMSLIGLTIVAIGTSLPEMATSVVAAYKKNADIAVGNVVGSNIFNLFFILGVSSVIKPLPFQTQSILDVGATLAASLFLFFFMFVGKRHVLDRWQGIFFILLYIVYIATRISFE